MRVSFNQTNIAKSTQNFIWTKNIYNIDEYLLVLKTEWYLHSNKCKLSILFNFWMLRLKFYIKCFQSGVSKFTTIFSFLEVKIPSFHGQKVTKTIIHIYRRGMILKMVKCKLNFISDILIIKEINKNITNTQKYVTNSKIYKNVLINLCQNI